MPQAPGAEDNASGVGALLATASAIAETRTRLPVVLVAFGSEEPPTAPLGSTPYAGYHSETDTPSVVRRSQVARATRIVVSWLR